MTDDNRRFETDSESGEQPFESTVDDAVAFFETAFSATGNWYGPRMSDILRVCVRAALESTGTVSPKKVARAARKLDEDDTFEMNAPVEPILRRLEAMIGEKGKISSGSGGA